MAQEQEAPADLADLCLTAERPLRDAVQCIDRNGKKIVLIVDGDQRLLGTITDGDVRRVILAGGSMDAPISGVLERKAGGRYSQPITAPLGASRESLLQLMREQVIHHVPLLDAEGRVAGLVALDDLLPTEPLALQAVIMAGGFGTRLHPLTNDTPKPMLPVGDRPLMEHIVEQLQQAGIHRVNVTTHYLAEKIIDHFGDGAEFGVELKYVTEDRPLGTAGALSLLQATDEPLLVMNGDILTRVDFRAMLAYHREHRAALTVGVRKYEFKVPYGVIENDGTYVRKVVEKPSLCFFVNAGIYLLEPAVHRLIPSGQRFDMTDLIGKLIEESLSVVSFPILEYWLDIGKHVDYEQAQQDLKAGRLAA